MLPVHTSPQAPASTAAVEEAILLLGDQLSEQSRRCIRHLSNFKASKPSIVFPPRKTAGVLILLHVNEIGGLNVILNKRSEKLRSHPGDVCLPGGRWEEGDESIEFTALREAFEEISLPPAAPGHEILHLTTLPAFTSGTLLVVIPSVFLLVATPEITAAILEKLIPNPAEVESIFHVPIYEFLGLPSSSPPPASFPTIQHQSLASRTTVPSPLNFSQISFLHTHEDLTWLCDKLYRLHSFAHPALPRSVTGLTADILITVSLLGYYGMSEDGEQAEMGLVASSVGVENTREMSKLGFERKAEGQMIWSEIVLEALRIHASGVKRQGLSAREVRTQV